MKRTSRRSLARLALGALVAAIVVRPRAVCAEESKMRPNLYPFAGNNGWGYCDQSGRTVIAARFQSARWFHEGLAWEMSNKGAFPLTHPAGQVKIYLRSNGVKVDGSRDFQDGRAVVRKGRL